ncbi:MAG: lipopolysaccharide heptosyltransferase II [Planctomycetes bacterium]|nr:lipopolysaccharide heptosyltransferase II [Planctomycetota bacterium]
MSDPESIIVRAPNWLGDCVMSLPVFDNLRKRFPRARIIAACRSHLAACYQAHGSVDETIICPQSERGLGGLLALWRDGGKLKERKIDTGILLTNSFSTAVWLWRSGARERIGFDRDGRGVFLTRKERVTPELAAAHQADYYLHLCGLAGAETKRTQPVLAVTPRGEKVAGSVIRRLGLTEKEYCLIAPVSAYGPVKDWPAKSFAEVSKKIRVEFGLPVLVTGIKSNFSACAEIADAAGDGVFNIAGETGVDGFLGLIAKAGIFLGNDSGGAHAAAACGVPAVVIFGITEPSRTRPLGEDVFIMGRGGAVTPDLKDKAVRKAAQEALEAISTDEVWEAVQEADRRRKKCGGES